MSGFTSVVPFPFNKSKFSLFFLSRLCLGRFHTEAHRLLAAVWLLSLSPELQGQISVLYELTDHSYSVIRAQNRLGGKLSWYRREE